MPTVKTLLPQKQADVQLIRVAAYCRVSSDSTEQKESFAAQVEYYTGLIGGNPFWTLADIYADEGVTGTSMRKRDDFNRMIADCRRGKIDRIITKSVSRFARNTVECLDTVRKLSKIGVSVLFEKEQMKRHVSLYFGKDDENSTAADEARAAELIEAITQAASAGQYTSQMQSLVDELNRVKAVIAEKKRRQSEAGQSSDRIEDIMAAIEKLKDTPMVFDNQAIRQIIACIKVVAKDEILIIFKGGLERSVKLH